MKTILSAFLLATMIAFMPGCKTTSAYKAPKTIDLVSITKKASKDLSRKAKKALPADSIILSTSLADINNLNTTSTLGRVLSEQLSSRLADQGYKLKEIKMRSNVFISQEKGGEFTLSRKLAAISKDHNARAILTGTYAIGSQTVYVNARLIDTASSYVLSTVDFQLPLDADMRALTRSNLETTKRKENKKVTRYFTR